MNSRRCRNLTSWTALYILLVAGSALAADPIELPVGETRVFSLEFSPDGKHLAVGTGGSTSGVKVFSVADQKLVHDIPCESRGAGFSVAFNRDGTKLAIGDYNLAVTVRQMTDGSEVASLPGDPERKKYRQARRVSFLPDGKRIVAGYSTGEIFVWDLEVKKVISQFDHQSSIGALAVSSDGTQIATGTDFGLRIWNVADRKAVVSLDEKSTGKHQVQAMAFLPDAKTIVTVEDPGKVRFFNASDGQEVRSFTMPSVGGSTTIPALCVADDGKTVIVPGLQAGLDPKRPQSLDVGLVILDASNAKPRSFIATGSPKVLALSRDGKKIAVGTGGSGDSVSVIDTASAVTLKP